MATEVAYVSITPHSIATSRTGGILSRLMSRTGLALVAARMFGPSRELAESYAALLRESTEPDNPLRSALADYVQRAYAPDPETGRKRRVLMLLFEGENAVARIRKAVGPVRPGGETGETIRDTFGDYAPGEDGAVRHLEPAVFAGASPEETARALRLWATHSEKDGGLVGDAADVPDDPAHQRALVLIKPDNFQFPSVRAGAIMDLFSRSGLRIIGAKLHRMSVAEAQEFYGPVREVLRTKLTDPVAERSARALGQELGIAIPDKVQSRLGELLGPLYGDQQFFEIVHFMTGRWVRECSETERKAPGLARCLALVYSGHEAIEQIRTILGPTNPSKAPTGSVRREFGKDIMVNAAHASDSPENAVREMNIVGIEKDTLKAWADRYAGA